MSSISMKTQEELVPQDQTTGGSVTPTDATAGATAGPSTRLASVAAIGVVEYEKQDFREMEVAIGATSA